MTIMLIIMMTMMMLFLFLKHPLSLGLILLMQTIMISLYSGMMHSNFWYSYILFIIMIGGMLILFMYMTSVASNEKFKFSMKILMLMIMIFLILNCLMPEMMNFYLNMKIQYNLINMKFSLNKYYNWPNNKIIYLMFFYLLITMIMVTKITKMNLGPLRQMNKN